MDDDRAEYDEPVDNLRVAADYYSAIQPHEIEHLRSIGFASWTQEDARQACAEALADAEAAR